MVCQLRQAIAEKVGGDTSFKSAHQPIRVAGSIHGKHGIRRLVEILDHRPIDYDLAEFADAVALMPALEPMPDNWRDFAVAPQQKPSMRELLVQPIREGGIDGTTRFEALSRVIGYWIRRSRDGHVSRAEAWEEIRGYNEASIRPPWPEDRLRREAERLWQKDQATVQVAAQAPSKLTEDGSVLPVAFTEDALASAFAERHESGWRYVAAWGQWYVWTGAHWIREETLCATDRARGICREAASSAPARQRTKLSAAATVSAVERLARSDRRLACAPAIWDTDAWLLNCPDTMVDLRTGTPLPHDPTRFVTKINGVDKVQPGRTASGRYGTGNLR
ncbi:MAG: hypothetical protein AAFQ17_07130, partial [Pseudomonadota bacterium]